MKKKIQNQSNVQQNEQFVESTEQKSFQEKFNVLCLRRLKHSLRMTSKLFSYLIKPNKMDRIF